MNMKKEADERKTFDGDHKCASELFRTGCHLRFGEANVQYIGLTTPNRDIIDRLIIML